MIAVSICVLAVFAMLDAYGSGSYYAIAILSVTAAIVAMITLFTAPDAPKLHQQLDDIRQELHVAAVDVPRLHQQLDDIRQELHDEASPAAG